MRLRRLFAFVIGFVVPFGLGLAPTSMGSASTQNDPGIGNVPQGNQTDDAYARSFAANGVTNVFVTS